VIRIYNTRFRECDRTPQVYLELGEGKMILNLQSSDNAKYDCDASYGEDHFWTWSNKKLLRVIETSYIVGLHCARRPTHFLPIIDHVQFLHKQGFVHGDIRAFNTVYDCDKVDDAKEPEGRLIDLDFSGRDGVATYPKGYERHLADGARLGNGETDSAYHVLQMWHDWYALGRLIFDVHKFIPPHGHARDNFYLKSLELEKFWLHMERRPSETDIENLEKMLTRMHDEGWTVKPNLLFGAYLNGAAKPGLHTRKGPISSHLKQLRA
jgi:hypothetical protein